MSNITDDVMSMIQTIGTGATNNVDSKLNTGEKIVVDKKSGRQFKEPVYSMQPFTPDDIPVDNFAFCVCSNDGLPDNIVELWNKFLPLLANKGMVLRTSLSTLDPLETITSQNYPRKEIYLPFKFKDYDGETPRLIGPKEKAYGMAAYLDGLMYKNATIDKFNNSSRLQKLFKALKMHILLGADLSQKVKFMVTWTSCGSVMLNKNTDYKAKGFAVETIYKCNKLGIKVYNLANQQSVEELKDLLGYSL